MFLQFFEDTISQFQNAIETGDIPTLCMLYQQKLGQILTVEPSTEFSFLQHLFTPLSQIDHLIPDIRRETAQNLAFIHCKDRYKQVGYVFHALDCDRCDILQEKALEAHSLIERNVWTLEMEDERVIEIYRVGTSCFSEWCHFVYDTKTLGFDGEYRISQRFVIPSSWHF